MPDIIKINIKIKTLPAVCWDNGHFTGLRSTEAYSQITREELAKIFWYKRKEHRDSYYLMQKWFNWFPWQNYYNQPERAREAKSDYLNDRTYAERRIAPEEIYELTGIDKNRQTQLSFLWESVSELSAGITPPLFSTSTAEHHTDMPAHDAAVDLNGRYIDIFHRSMIDGKVYLMCEFYVDRGLYRNVPIENLSSGRTPEGSGSDHLFIPYNEPCWVAVFSEKPAPGRLENIRQQLAQNGICARTVRLPDMDELLKILRQQGYTENCWLEKGGSGSDEEGIPVFYLPDYTQIFKQTLSEIDDAKRDVMEYRGQLYPPVEGCSGDNEKRLKYLTLSLLQMEKGEKYEHELTDAALQDLYCFYHESSSAEALLNKYLLRLARLICIPELHECLFDNFFLYKENRTDKGIEKMTEQLTETGWLLFTDSQLYEPLQNLFKDAFSVYNSQLSEAPASYWKSCRKIKKLDMIEVYDNCIKNDLSANIFTACIAPVNGMDQCVQLPVLEAFLPYYVSISDKQGCVDVPLLAEIINKNCGKPVGTPGSTVAVSEKELRNESLDQEMFDSTIGRLSSKAKNMFIKKTVKQMDEQTDAAGHMILTYNLLQCCITVTEGNAPADDILKFAGGVTAAFVEWNKIPANLQRSSHITKLLSIGLKHISSIVDFVVAVKKSTRYLESGNDKAFEASFFAAVIPLFLCCATIPAAAGIAIDVVIIFLTTMFNKSAEILNNDEFDYWIKFSKNGIYAAKAIQSADRKVKKEWLEFNKLLPVDSDKWKTTEAQIAYFYQLPFVFTIKEAECYSYIGDRNTQNLYFCHLEVHTAGSSNEFSIKLTDGNGVGKFTFDDSSWFAVEKEKGVSEVYSHETLTGTFNTMNVKRDIYTNKFRMEGFVNNYPLVQKNTLSHYTVKRTAESYRLRKTGGRIFILYNTKKHLFYEVYCIYFQTLIPAELQNLQIQFYRNYISNSRQEPVCSSNTIRMDTVYRSKKGDIKQFAWGYIKHSEPGFAWKLKQWGPGGCSSTDVIYSADIKRTISDPAQVTAQSATAQLSVSYEHQSIDNLEDSVLRKEILKHLSGLM